MEGIVDEDLLNSWNYEKGHIPVNPSLGLCCVPQLGQYSEEYAWLEPTLAINCS